MPELKVQAGAVADRMAHDLVELADHRVQIDLLWLAGVATDEGEDLTGQTSGLADAPVGSFELLLTTVIEGLAAQLLQTAQGDRQEIVELMGDTSCDGANDLNPLRLISRTLQAGGGVSIERKRQFHGRSRLAILVAIPVPIVRHGSAPQLLWPSRSRGCRNIADPGERQGVV